MNGPEEARPYPFRGAQNLSSNRLMHCFYWANDLGSGCSVAAPHSGIAGPIVSFDVDRQATVTSPKSFSSQEMHYRTKLG